MFRKNVFIIFAALLAATFVFSSCGGGGGSGKAPAVDVVEDPSGDNSSGSSTSDGSTSGEVDNGTSGQEETNFVLIIRTDSSGDLTVNNESIDEDDYNPIENSSASINVRDENGNYITWRIDDDGNLIVVPGNGTVEGTYTVTINTGEREYTLVINVDADKNASVTTAVSCPAGSSIAVDLDAGNLVVNGETVVSVAAGSAGSYGLNPSITGIEVKNSSGTVLDASVDPVTGDIVIAGDNTGPYTVTITTSDGRVISFTTDSYGQLTGSVTVTGCAVMLNLDNGSISAGGISLDITQGGSGSWYLGSGVEILAATAGGGGITLQAQNIVVDAVTGDIMVKVNDTVAPAGPYAVTISVNGKLYIIRTDATGTVTEIIPGNILLQLSNGYAVHCGRNILKMAEAVNGSWALSGKISSVSAVDSGNSSIGLSVDAGTGNLVTADTASGAVTIAFNYTDEKGNVIAYRLSVINGVINSFWAEVSEPGPDFDFSTVTNVKISLRVVDSKTGLPVKQASISLDSADRWQGFTDDNGVSVFTATVESASKTSKIIVTHPSYESVEQQISGLGRLIEYGKNIAMVPVESPAVADSDGDGVPDSEDSFPDDATGARSITGVYTIAFEDLYPSKGDADFNDLVVRLTITEKIDSQNRLRRIDLKTKLLASGAAYKNQFWINIGGKSYELIGNPKAVSVYTLGSTWYNSRKTEQYRDCEELSHDPVIFENGIPRTDIAPMPYDPFIICNGVAGKEVHLPFVNTAYTGAVLDSDGFSWAVLVPDDWAWPYEAGKIYYAYPEFYDWYRSDGLSSADWYLRYEGSLIFRH